VVELVDTSVLGADAARREGSSPFILTKRKDLSSSEVFSFGSAFKDLTKNEQNCLWQFCRNQRTSPFSYRS
jgi:hypothetical protein